LIFGIVLGLLGVGGVFAFGRYQEQQEIIRQTAVAQATSAVFSAATSTVQTAVAIAGATATREALVARLTATAGAKIVTTPTAPPAALGVGTVLAGGNLRKEPRVAPETVVGLISPGDEVAFLEQTQANGSTWFHIRITKGGPNRAEPAAPVGADGWASSTLLSPPRAP
jgi:hypothetical protein